MILQYIPLVNHFSTLKTNINLAPIALMKQTNKKINIKIIFKNTECINLFGFTRRV